MQIGGVKVIRNYDYIDRKNMKAMASQEPYDLDRYMYVCIVCARKTTMQRSFSYRGHNLICHECANKHFQGSYHSYLTAMQTRY